MSVTSSALGGVPSGKSTSGFVMSMHFTLPRAAGQTREPERIRVLPDPRASGPVCASGGGEGDRVTVPGTAGRQCTHALYGDRAIRGRARAGLPAGGGERADAA